MALSNGKQLLSHYFQPALTVASKAPWGSSGERAQCICLGVQHPLKRWCYRLRIDSMGPNISRKKKKGGGYFFLFIGIVSVQCQGILRTSVSAALQNPRRMHTWLKLRSNISRTSAIPVELNHETKLWRKLNRFWAVELTTQGHWLTIKDM